MVLQILRVTNLPLFHAKPLPRYSSGFADGCLGPHEGGVVEVQIRRTRGTGDILARKTHAVESGVMEGLDETLGCPVS